MAKTLKVILITPGFAADENETYNIPSLQEYALALGEAIGKENVKIIAVQYPVYRKMYKWNAIEVFPCGTQRTGLLRLFITLRRTRGIVKALTKKDTYVLHSFFFTDATFITQYINRTFRLTHIATMMGQDAKRDNKYLRLLRYNSCKTVALSAYQEEIFFHSTGRHADRIIPFFITSTENDLSCQTRDIDILFVASFIELKHPEQFVQIVESVRQKYPDLKAVMIGQGDLVDEMKNLIQEKNLTETVQLTGILPRPEVYVWMRRSKILLHTSDYEGQCLVYMEALAHGMHVVSYPVGRIEQTSKHIICTKQEDMIAVINKLLGQNLSYDAYIAVTKEDIVKQYLQLYSAE